jgi:hypothetical protein
VYINSILKNLHTQSRVFSKRKRVTVESYFLYKEAFHLHLVYYYSLLFLLFFLSSSSLLLPVHTVNGEGDEVEERRKIKRREERRMEEEGGGGFQQGRLEEGEYDKERREGREREEDKDLRKESGESIEGIGRGERHIV